MSYAIEQRCFICKKQDKCIDKNFISAAISGIHDAGIEKGHLGSGSIKIECENFVEF